MTSPITRFDLAELTGDEGLLETDVAYRVLELDRNAAQNNLKIDVGKWAYMQLLQVSDDVEIRVGSENADLIPVPVGIVNIRHVDRIFLTSGAGNEEDIVARILFSRGFVVAPTQEPPQEWSRHPRDLETDEITGIDSVGVIWNPPTGSAPIFGLVLKAPSTNPDNVEISKSGGGGYGAFVLEPGQEIRINARRGVGSAADEWDLSLVSSGAGTNTLWALIEYVSV